MIIPESCISLFLVSNLWRRLLRLLLLLSLQDIGLSISMFSLALILYIPPSGLTLPITCDSSANTTQGSLHALRDALTEILYLALSLLGLALSVLPDALLAKIFVANQISNGFLCGSDCLVP